MDIFKKKNGSNKESDTTTSKKDDKPKKEKLVSLYICSINDGEKSAFEKPEELGAHLQEEHNIIAVTTEEILPYKSEVTKNEAKQLLTETKKAIKRKKQEEAIVTKRIETRLATEEEPETLVNIDTVTDAKDVFKKAVGKLSKPDGGQNETFFAEEMTEDGISISCVVEVANNQETQEAIANFKKIMFKYKI